MKIDLTKDEISVITRVLRSFSTQNIDMIVFESARKKLDEAYEKLGGWQSEVKK